MTPKEFAAGKTIRNIEVHKLITYVNFEDGTSCSVAWDGDRLRAMAVDERGNLIQLCEEEQADNLREEATAKP